MRIAILISGRGSNMLSLIKACTQPDFPGQVVGVISDRADAAGLKLAYQSGIPAMIVDRAAFPTKRDFEQALLETLTPWRTNLVCLAGFMRVLSPHFINGVKGQVINIHPSLLPKYPGLDTHARALSAGDTLAGATVHWVTPALDAGEIIIQESVAILPNDTANTLAERVLIAEHALYPQALRLIAKERNAMSHPTTSTNTPHVIKAEIERSTRMWDIFAKASLIAAVVIAGILSLMGLFLV